MNPQAIIFDCDGTLVDSEAPAIAVLHQMIGELGIDITAAQARQQFLGVRMADCVRWIGSQLAVKADDFDADFTARLRNATELRFRQGLSAMPGAHDLLARLQGPICVATNGPREKVELTLELTGLRRYFPEHIYCAYETGYFKPDPGLFLHAAHAMGVAPAHCAVVEDSLPGLQAGVAAGMQVYSLYPASDTPAELRTQVHRISGLADLLHCLPAPWLAANSVLQR
jgi:HAD superfamily hydrolase (TIGR01509 family)